MYSQNHTTRLSQRLFFITLILLGLLPNQLSAQVARSLVASSLGSNDSVGASAAFGIGVTRFNERGVPTLSAEAQLQLTPRVRFGVQGVRLTEGVRTSPADSPDQSEAHLAYAGIRGEVESGWQDMRAALLLAGATTRLKSPLLDREVATRNFLLVELQARRTLIQFRGLSGDVQLGYRIPLGAPSLPGVQLNDLRGPVLSITLGAGLAP
jgi:hypothetical protein